MSQAARASAAGASTGTTSLAIALTLAAALVATAGSASAQSLEREIRVARDGWVLFQYATDREVEICEDGGMRREAVEELMEIALGEEDTDLQKSALFWLGQSDDPRVADFLLELIRPRVVR